MNFFWKARCHRLGDEIWIVYGDDEADWPSYAIWIVPGTCQ